MVVVVVVVVVVMLVLVVVVINASGDASGDAGGDVDGHLEHWWPNRVRRVVCGARHAQHVHLLVDCLCKNGGYDAHLLID